jgi:two-component system, OmpR family, response regulator VicR
MTNKKIKVLIADDEKALGNAIKLKLEHEGIEAKLVSNGLEAVDLLEKEEFDMVILDLVMPKLDGFGVLEKIKENKITVPVVVASNLMQEVDIRRAKDLGVADFLVKSDTPVLEIVKKIKNLVSK